MFLDKLYFQDEEKNIIQAIGDSEREINFKSMVATKENLSEVLDKGPKILHISCHGIENNAKTNKY